MAFDAYFKWLGIPPDQQPPDHYRLLGIPSLIDDADVIETAADQRMMLLRTKSGGQYGTMAEQLMQEVSRAKLCLLNAQTKALYDSQLTEQSIPPPAPAVEPPPPPPPPSPLEDKFEPLPNITPTETHRGSTGGGFLDKVLATGREWSAKARVAAQHTAMYAEKAKIQNIELPQAYQRLGAEVVKLGAGRAELNEYYQKIHALAVRLRNLEVEDDPDATIAEFARSAADRVKNTVESQQVSSQLNAAYRQLGQAVYDRHRDGAPSAVLAEVNACLQRLAGIEHELNSDE